MRESPYPLEQSLGLSWYATEIEGIGGHLREKAEDFVVEEVPVSSWGETGRYLILKLTKRNWEQQRLVKELARALGISHRRISWAGTKDRRALTTQYVSIHGLEPGALERIALPDVRLEPVGRSDHAIALGELAGNRFRIRIRECTPACLAERAGEVTRAAASGFPNFVGIQRFGVVRPVTHLVGERILKGDPEGAVLVYLGATFPAEPAELPEVREARESYLAERDAKEALRRFPVRLTFERAMLHHLDSHPGDSPGALRALPSRLLSMFVSAYQSFLFNLLLSRRCGRGIPLNEPAPGDRLLFIDGREDRVTRGNLEAAALQVSRGRARIGLFVPGSGPWPGQESDGDPARALLGELGITAEGFACASKLVMAAYSGVTRPVALTPEITYRVEGRDLLLEFFLGPGQYATTVCREFMKAEPARMV